MSQTPPRSRQAVLRAALMAILLAVVPVLTRAAAPPATQPSRQVATLDDRAAPWDARVLQVPAGSSMAMRGSAHFERLANSHIDTSTARLSSRPSHNPAALAYLPLVVRGAAQEDILAPAAMKPADWPATCGGPEPHGEAFRAGPYATAFYGLAGPFALKTMDGTWDIREKWTGCESYVFLLTTHESTFAKGIWDTSIAELFASSPANVHYFFASYADASDDLMADVQFAKERVDKAVAAIEKTDPQAAAHWRSHMHFVTQSIGTVGGWLKDMLTASSEEVPGVSAQWTAADGARTLQPESFGGRGPWLPKVSDVAESFTGDLAWYGDACNLEGGAPSKPAQDVKGKIALIVRGVCPYYDKVWNAEKQGAIAALIFTDARPKITMGCSAPSNCAAGPSIPAAVIDSAPGEQLKTLVTGGTAVVVSMSAEQQGPFFFAIDRLQRLREPGVLSFVNEPLLIGHLGYEANYYNFEWQQDQHLKAETAKVIPVFLDTEAADPGWAGVRSTVTVTLPSAVEMAAYDSLELDLAMRCTGDGRDGNCPAWDYLVYLYLCDAKDTTKCDREIGRWITAYGRPGRWVMDVSPILADLAEGGPRVFQFYTQQRYKLDLSMRLLHRHKAGLPRELVPLFTGGQFDADYNKARQPITVTVPADVRRVDLMAVISGHGFGADSADCAEFCNHTHHFMVNGKEFVKSHPEAGTDIGCALQTGIGVVPNQYGTWQYGRGGWCPGQEVKPWIVDVTEAIRRGEPNVLTYRGLWENKDTWPDVTDPAGFRGRIDMLSYLVYYR